MSNIEDHSWNLSGSDQAWQKKIEEWAARDWAKWLSEKLTFPFVVTREEDDDDAYFKAGAAKAPFRLGHKMEVLSLADEDVDRGIMVKVREKNLTDYVPLCDVKVRPKSDKNFWPAREYVAWFANRD